MLPLIFLVILVVKIESYMLASPEFTNGTCKEKCNLTDLQNEYQCQCHDICFIMRNCCRDYQEICKRQSIDFIKVSDDSLEEFSEELYHIEKSVYQASFKYELGKSHTGKCNGVSPNRFFKEVLPSSFQTKTVEALIAIHDGGIFHVDVNKAEDYKEKDKILIDKFIDAVLLTEVWKKAATFLSNRLKKEVTKDDFYEMWFGLYSRATNKMKGSSAFEHTFLGEIKDDNVSGFHNWIYFQREENAQRISYFGYKGYRELLKSTSTRQPNWDNYILLVEHTFEWKEKCKERSSMFMGTSPEFEIALYTVCRYVHFKKSCPLKINGTPLFIKTHAAPGKKEMFGSAYPSITS